MFIFMIRRLFLIKLQCFFLGCNWLLASVILVYFLCEKNRFSPNKAIKQLLDASLRRQNYIAFHFFFQLYFDMAFNLIQKLKPIEFFFFSTFHHWFNIQVSLFRLAVKKQFLPVSFWNISLIFCILFSSLYLLFLYHTSNCFKWILYVCFHWNSNQQVVCNKQANKHRSVLELFLIRSSQLQSI